MRAAFFALPADALEHLALRPAIEHLAMIQCLAANDRGAASDPREVLLCGAFVTLSVQPV